MLKTMMFMSWSCSVGSINRVMSEADVAADLASSSSD